MIQASELAEINSLNKHSHELISFKTSSTRLDAPVGSIIDIFILIHFWSKNKKHNGFECPLIHKHNARKWLFFIFMGKICPL